VKRIIQVAAIVHLLFAQLLQSLARADTFGRGANTFEIQFVTIGQPGNVADTTGDPNPAGAVPYSYRIGKYEIPEDAVRKAYAQSALDGAPLGVTLDTRGPNKPATRLSWFEAATFVNWLNTSTGHTPAYKFDSLGAFQLWQPTDPGYDPNNLYRNWRARYFLPSADEWYKAAFYDPVTHQYFDFPNGSDTAPIPVASGTALGTAVYDQPFEQGPADIMLAGGPSPFGTFGQAGNVWEWEETAVDLLNDDPAENRGFRGSAWLPVSGDPLSLSSNFRHFIQLPGNSIGDTGFRVASIPEPSAAWLIVSGFSALLLRRLYGYRR
jgi:formylglycine-generating enzyme required for sulfatase activity